MTLKEANILSILIVLGIIIFSAICCLFDDPIVIAIGTIIFTSFSVLVQITLKYIIWFIGDYFK